MGWHGVANAPLGNSMPAFFHPWEFFYKFYCCYIYVAVKEKSPEILLELNLGRSDVLES